MPLPCTMLLTDTSIGVQVCQRLTALTRLTSLDLGGQPTTDACCASLAQHLTRLQHLSLWGSQVTDAAVAMLADLRHLSSLDLSWTPVRVLPAYEQLQVSGNKWPLWWCCLPRSSSLLPPAAAVDCLLHITPLSCVRCTATAAAAT